MDGGAEGELPIVVFVSDGDVGTEGPDSLNGQHVTRPYELRQIFRIFIRRGGDKL